MRRYVKTWGGRALLVGAGLFLAALAVVPFPHERLRRYPAAEVLLDAAGQPLRVQLGPGGLDCRPGYVARPEDWIARALIAAEDQRFRHHPGLDLAALGRAVWQNVGAGRRVSGASTLSTQVIRLVQPRPRTWTAKAVEAFRALQMELRYSKDEILTQYLNRAPFGGNLVGIEAASRRYFSKGAHDLSLAEAALLAGLPQSPARLRPDRHPARARARQRYVLDRMLACGFITAAEHRSALDLRVALRRESYPLRAPHFAEAAAAGGAAAGRTSLDPAWQARAEAALRRQVEALRARGVEGGAVVVLEVRRGLVCALAGSPDFADPAAGQVNGALARRSAGSTLKPFLYAAALDAGLITPASALADVPRVFTESAPENFDGTFLGLVPAREALVRSLNLPMMELTERLGVGRFQGVLRQFGLATIEGGPERYGLGLAVGNAEVRLLDLANAYAALARGGRYQAIGFRAEAEIPAAARGCSPAAAWLVAEALAGEERAREATGHRADVRLPRLAWKTGTSTGFRDAWTVAYNPDYVVAVWLGNPSGRSSPALVGVEAAAPVAWELFRLAYPEGDGPWFARPAELVSRSVCARTGDRPGLCCPDTMADWSIAGVSAHRTCAVHGRDGVEHWPPEIAAYLNRSGGARPAASGVKIVTPAAHSQYRLVEDWPGAEQRLNLLAAGDQDLHWFVDDRYVGQARGGTPLSWRLTRGTHRIVCSDPAGRSDLVTIEVN